MLKNPLAITEVAPFLKSQHFYKAQNRHVYAAMEALFDRAAAIDYHTIAEELTRNGTCESAGGLMYLSEVNLATPSAAHIEYYARIVVSSPSRRASAFHWSRAEKLLSHNRGARGSFGALLCDLSCG